MSGRINERIEYRRLSFRPLERYPQSASAARLFHPFKKAVIGQCRRPEMLVQRRRHEWSD
jgi:hypothetical protein